jgi:copper(I)-binding protein
MKRIAFAVALVVAAAPALAQVKVSDPWVRATVPHQSATGAYMTLESPRDARVVSVSSPVAGVVELHEMKMEKEIMRMRAVASVALPAGKGVELKPGGYHVMMMNLKRQMKEGDVVPITLVVEGKDGKRETIEVKAAVRPVNATGPGGDRGGMPMKH